MSWKKIVLCSSDMELFVVEEDVIFQSQTIKNMIEDGCINHKIPRINVNSKTLSKVIDYCIMHAYHHHHALKDWDANFVIVDINTLYDLIIAANFLGIESLMDLLLETLANIIKGKNVEEIHEIFKIESDFTPREEDQI